MALDQGRLRYSLFRNGVSHFIMSFLLGGAFDADLRLGTPELRSLATPRGWVDKGAFGLQADPSDGRTLGCHAGDFG